jgi:NhaP-type Na+/H+ or K+/H+ antiporter
LTAQGKAATSSIFSFLLHISDAICFAVIGLSLYTCIPGYWSWSFLTLTFFAVIAARVIAIFLLFYAFSACFGPKRLSFREILYIMWGGMVRGSVCYGLAIQLATSCTNGDFCPD